MAKISVDANEFAQLWVLIGYHYLMNPNKLAAPEVRELFEKLNQSKIYFHKGFLKINPQIRILLKRILPFLNGEARKDQSYIIDLTNTKENKKKGKVSTIIQKLLSQKEISKSEFEFLKETVEFDMCKEDYKPEKVYHKYI